MKLTGEEQAMRAGEFGPLRQWAIAHQIKVGRYLGAADFVPVTQAHIMADTESLGEAGIAWLEGWAKLRFEAAKRGRRCHGAGPEFKHALIEGALLIGALGLGRALEQSPAGEHGE